MKTKLFAVCLLFALAGCDFGGIRGNRHMITQERKLEPFVFAYTSVTGNRAPI